MQQNSQTKVGRAKPSAAKKDGRYYRRGLGLKKVIKPQVETEYGSALITLLRENDYELSVGRLHFRLARSFGFCYGVDRAVEYTYETRLKFPDRRTFLVGEIVHNPYVNLRLRSSGIEYIYGESRDHFDFSEVTPEDVVILPAFGVPKNAFDDLRALGCILVDTTCGSVLNVWKRVESYARDGFTTVVHGKYWHEETWSTSSQVHKYDDAHFLIILNMEEADIVCGHIRGEVGRDDFMARFGKSHSPGFDPDIHLRRIGVANQTTMIASESLAIAAKLAEAMADRWGEDALPDRFRSFDTICSATQKRQDALYELLENPPDVMVVVGGHNSSNTTHLAHLCEARTATYHIDRPESLDPETGGVSHLTSDRGVVLTDKWLPDGEVDIGLTAGASSPDISIGETVERILRVAGYDPAEACARLYKEIEA